MLILLARLKPQTKFEVVGLPGYYGEVITVNECSAHIKRLGAGNERISPSTVVRVVDSFPQPEPEPETTDKERTVTKQGARKRQTLFGLPVTAVLRWMGKNKVDAETAMKCLKNYGITAAESTVKIQLKAGAEGKRGGAPKMPRKDVKELKEALSGC